MSIIVKINTLLILIFEVLDDIHDRFSDLLDSLDLIWLDPGLFSQVIHWKGAPLTQCWGFIDGTPRPIARPTRNQQIMYSGHKRTHCIKFQVQLHVVCNLNVTNISLSIGFVLEPEFHKATLLTIPQPFLNNKHQ